MAELVNFTDINDAEKLKILSWRNNDNVRFNMYNSDMITEDTHFAFIERLKDDGARQYFLVKEDGKDIGVVYFGDICGESTVMGIYASPDAVGAGKILMSQILDYAYNTLKVKRIIAEVFADNAKASNLYAKYGFKAFDKKIVNSRDVICMELINENR